MRAKWENDIPQSFSTWNVVNVWGKSFDGLKVWLGQDNTRPDETRWQTEWRIAKRFERKPAELILEIL